MSSAKHNKTILIAGGAGFVGSHLADFLVARGHNIVAVDNLSTGKKKNIAHLLKHKNFKFIKADVTSLSRPAGTLPKSWGGSRLDEIYHLASPASPIQYRKNPIATWKANTLGTLNLLELARKNRAKFLFASTSEIYGDPLVHPQKELYWGNVNPVGERSCYDESKRAAESLCADYCRVHKLDVKIARIFNTYGPRMDKHDGRVVSNFFAQALAKRPLTIYGSGKQTRSFQYVDDLVSGLVKLMAAKNFLGPVNLGNPGEFTVSDLARKIINITKSTSSLIYKPLPKDDPKQRKPDISLAKKVLAWRPKINLGTGLKKTLSTLKRGV